MAWQAWRDYRTEAGCLPSQTIHPHLPSPAPGSLAELPTTSICMVTLTPVKTRNLCHTRSCIPEHPEAGGAWRGTVLPRSSGIFSERLDSFSLKLLCFLFSPFAPLLSMVWCPRRVQEQTPAGPSKGHIPHCLCCSLQLAYMDPLIACMSFRLFSMHELSAKPCWKHWNFTFFMEIFHIKWAVSHFPWNS